MKYVSLSPSLLRNRFTITSYEVNKLYLNVQNFFYNFFTTTQLNGKKQWNMPTVTTKSLRNFILFYIEHILYVLSLE